MVARQRREQANDVHNPMAPMLDRNGLPGGNGLPKDGPDFANMIKKVRDLQDARVEPGELTQMTDGVSPIKSAVDLGDKLAVRTLAELDPLTLTAPCCQAGPVLVYLRNNPEHEHHAKMVECVEGLLLQSGLVPFKDGTAVPVQILEEVMSNEGRDEEWLKQCLRAAKVDFRQFKTLREVGRLGRRVAASAAAAPSRPLLWAEYPRHHLSLSPPTTLALGRSSSSRPGS